MLSIHLSHSFGLALSQSVSQSVSQTFSLFCDVSSLLVISYLFHQLQEYAYVCVLLLMLLLLFLHQWFIVVWHMRAVYLREWYFFLFLGNEKLLDAQHRAHTRTHKHAHSQCSVACCYFVCSFAKWYKTNTIMLIKKNSYALSSLFSTRKRK